jgi:hypothetical protein
MNKSLILLCSVFSICFMQFTACLQAQSASPTDSQAIIQQLKVENEALKQQLQELRKLLVNSQGQPSGVTAPQGISTGITAAPSAQKQSTGFWITSSSRKRHNSNCRYFQNSNGSPCGPNDGIPCKICGG